MRRVLTLTVCSVLVMFAPACSSSGSAPKDVSTLQNLPAGSPDAFAFVDTNPGDGSPVRYNPCQALHFVINPAGAPLGGVELAREAAALVAAATGITIVDDGLTTELPAANSRSANLRRVYQPEVYDKSRWAPLLIGWLDLTETDLFQPTDIGGNGGSLAAAPPAGPRTYITGSVTINSKIPRRIHKLALMHEFGHAMGLDHVEDRRQVMAPVAPDFINKRPAWGAGDIAGLAKLGRAAGCLPEIPPGATSQGP